MINATDLYAKTIEALGKKFEDVMPEIEAAVIQTAAAGKSGVSLFLSKNPYGDDMTGNEIQSYDQTLQHYLKCLGYYAAVNAITDRDSFKFHLALNWDSQSTGHTANSLANAYMSYPR